MIFNYEKERPKEVMPIAVCLIVSQLNLIWMKKSTRKKRTKENRWLFGILAVDLILAHTFTHY